MLSEKKHELQVAALENGTVIDHIPSERLFTVVSLLGLEHMSNNITIGFNLKSKKLGGATHAVGQFAEKPFVELPPLPESAYGFAAPRKGFHGVIGPRSTYSIGKSTVAEYAQAARRAKWDFIVFLEDFSRLDYGAFARQQAECARLSDGSLLLVPGVAYQDEDDAWHYLFSAKVKLPAEWMLMPGTRKLKLSYVSGRDKRPGAQIAFLHHSNPIANSTTHLLQLGL